MKNRQGKVEKKNLRWSRPTIDRSEAKRESEAINQIFDAANELREARRNFEEALHKYARAITPGILISERFRAAGAYSTPKSSRKRSSLSNAGPRNCLA